jgi:hypothetical protein
MRKQSFTIAILGIFLFVLHACDKETIEPENPFDAIQDSNNTPATDTVSKTSLLGLHRNTFSTKCAVPGCHDGNFEPDFRTVQSAFSTLVYAPITKNNITNSFTYRVVPGDTNLSVLYERITNCCFVNSDDRMPQDNIGTGLPASDIRNIASWIMNGAPNVSGEIVSRPDLEPVLSYYVAVNTTFDVEYSTEANRVDSLIYNAFYIPNGTSSFYMGVLVEDDNTPLANMQVNTLLLSTNKDDFSAAIPFTATYINVQGQDPIWLTSVNISNLIPGTIYYMRYRVNDGQHTNNTEFPENTSNEFYKSYWSFIIQP